MAAGKRSDPAKIRQQQRRIAEDYVSRERQKSEGDVVSSPKRPVSPPARPQPLKRPQRVNPTSRRGVVTGWKKGSNVA
jgi:hypothetical protein